jgi:hypothetical protein
MEEVDYTHIVGRESLVEQVAVEEKRNAKVQQ